MKVNVMSIDGAVKHSIDLPETIFGLEDNPGLVWEAVTNYLANQRQGTAKAKTRGEVRGGGKKPWRQKHTGRARVGSIRSPVWVGGGTVFGPHPRDYSYKIPKQKKQKALCTALSMKLKHLGIKLIEDFELENNKTKKMAKALKALGFSDAKTILVKDTYSKNMLLASRNIANFDLTTGKDLNIYDCVASDNLIITVKGLDSLLKRLVKEAN
ncbi:MAG: 50S ribosomal protein L4 [Candidatus Latescibacteria bacterium]|nr:50S ribosomal protein L4 [Candidatus Latescibacterota bacterium]